MLLWLWIDRSRSGKEGFERQTGKELLKVTLHQAIQETFCILKNSTTKRNKLIKLGIISSNDKKLQIPEFHLTTKVTPV